MIYNEYYIYILERNKTLFIFFTIQLNKNKIKPYITVGKNYLFNYLAIWGHQTLELL